MRRITATVGLLLAFGVMAAYADPVGGGYIGGGEVGAGLNDGVGGGPGSVGTAGAAGSTTGGGTGGGEHNPIQWVRTYGAPCIKYSSAPGDEGVALGEVPPLQPGQEQGQYYWDNLVNTDTGEVIVSSSSTASKGCTYPSKPVPLPPAPPSAADVRDRTPLPTPAWGVSPQGDGLTGLATWLWDSNGAAGRDVTVNVRGYTATAHAAPTGWRWTMAASGEPGPASKANPDPVLVAHFPGSATTPAATYVYETPGGYTLTLDVAWQGTYTYTPPGGGPVTQPLGSIVRTSSRSYQVAEVRPVIVTGLNT